MKITLYTIKTISYWDLETNEPVIEECKGFIVPAGFIEGKAEHIEPYELNGVSFLTKTKQTRKPIFKFIRYEQNPCDTFPVSTDIDKVFYPYKSFFIELNQIIDSEEIEIPEKEDIVIENIVDIQAMKKEFKELKKKNEKTKQ